MPQHDGCGEHVIYTRSVYKGDPMRLLCRCLIIFVILCVGGVVTPAGAMVKDDQYRTRVLMEKNGSESAIADYKRRIGEMELDALNLKSEHEWLLLKIMRIENRKDPVPGELLHSKMLIEKKLKSMTREKKELQGLIANHYKKLGGLDKQVRQRYLKKRPEWWHLNPDTVKEIGALKKPVQKTVKKKKTSAKRVQKKAEISKRIRLAGLGDWVELIDGTTGLRLENRLPIIFSSGKMAVSAEYGKFLKSLAQLVKRYPSRVKVEGFTDKSRIKSKKFASNFELGARRASNVAGELIKYGVNPATLTIESQGEYGITVPGSNKKSRAMSRKVEITVYFK